MKLVTFLKTYWASIIGAGTVAFLALLGMGAYLGPSKFTGCKDCPPLPPKPALEVFMGDYIWAITGAIFILAFVIFYLIQRSIETKKKI